MEITDITAFITLILAISLASERLIAIFKTIFPWLGATPNPAKQQDNKEEIIRKILVMALAFVCCWFTASIINGLPLKEIITVNGVKRAPTILLGLLGSGGSAFWTSILGYTKAVKDIKVQKLQQEKLQTDALIKSTRLSQRQS